MSFFYILFFLVMQTLRNYSVLVFCKHYYIFEHSKMLDERLEHY